MRDDVSALLPGTDGGRGGGGGQRQAGEVKGADRDGSTSSSPKSAERSLRVNYAPPRSPVDLDDSIVGSNNDEWDEASKAVAAALRATEEAIVGASEAVAALKRANSTATARVSSPSSLLTRNGAEKGAGGSPQKGRRGATAPPLPRIDDAEGEGDDAATRDDAGAIPSKAAAEGTLERSFVGVAGKAAGGYFERLCAGAVWVLASASVSSLSSAAPRFFSPLARGDKLRRPPPPSCVPLTPY